MLEFFNAFQAVFTIVILVCLGYILQKKGKITDSIGGFISYFLVNITLPCSVFKTVTNSLTAEKIIDLPKYVIVIMISQIVSMLIAWIFTKVISVDNEKRGSLIVLTAFNNTLFMGMPVSVALFGDSSSSIILCYYIASTILFWSIGVRIIAGEKVKGKFKIPSPLYGLVLGIAVVITKSFFPSFDLPVFVNDSIKYVAGITTPLSMIFTGFALGQFGLENIKLNKNVCVGLIARFIISPIIFIGAIMLLKVDTLSRNVFIVQAFMPVMASQTVIARQYGVDDKYPAVMVTLSTVLSLIIIPIVKTVIT